MVLKYDIYHMCFYLMATSVPLIRAERQGTNFAKRNKAALESGEMRWEVATQCGPLTELGFFWGGEGCTMHRARKKS